MYSYKIKPNPSLIIFPKVREKDCASEINNKDLRIKISKESNLQGTNEAHIKICKE